ncbi:DUF3347 domain-containing protein [Sphingobacterium hungaricum]|uniref:Mercury transporter n=1 Tax=Sphingobacterium hungaricum TaxID=2082723 RepID=A0A928V1K1_9SPHI|nr:DUF3347 domain-containing protein [Sphingobacterium hungaricum]MBE8714454.1 mercury transporter [Sphingobacterium hungaricum]
MKSSRYWMTVSMLLLTIFAFAQVKNSQTMTVSINGNCGMCKKTIEQAGSVTKEAIVEWDADSESAKLTFDSTKTSEDAILKRIALAGYDNEKYLAPEETYQNLHACCQYERTLKAEENPSAENASEHQHGTVENQEQINTLQTVFDGYFKLKDALVKSDANASSTQASAMLVSLEAIKMDKLSAEEHTSWMNVKNSLIEQSKLIAKQKDLKKQRAEFNTLSTKMYELMKTSDTQQTIYYQHCPMYNDGQGGNWLSKEDAIKNPYYGSQMLTCGNTVEKI